MKIVNLIENTLGKKEVLFEHGLSFYIETTHHNIMLDAGQTTACLENAKNLGIDIKKIDTFVLSHGHYDHSGGLLEFANQNKTANIYLQKSAGLGYYHVYTQNKDKVNHNSISNSEILTTNTENIVYKYIGIDPQILQLPQLIFFSQCHQVNSCNKISNMQQRYDIDKELSLFCGVTGRILWPQGNFELKRKEGELFVQDEFEHEQYLVVEDEGKTILLSGCAHNGILNILETFQVLYQKEPDIVISGFHMKKKTYTKEDKEIFKETAKELKKTKSIYYTGHCTGEYAYQIMKEIMGDQLHYVHSGEEIYI